MNIESESSVRVEFGGVDRAVHVCRCLGERFRVWFAYEVTAIGMDTGSHGGSCSYVRVGGRFGE